RATHSEFHPSSNHLKKSEAFALLTTTGSGVFTCNLMISFSLLSNILKPYIFMEILVLGWANLGPLIRICPYIYTNVKPLFLPILIPFNPSAYVLFDQTDPGTKGIGKNTCCQGHVWGPWDGSGTDP